MGVNQSVPKITKQDKAILECVPSVISHGDTTDSGTSSNVA